MAPQQNSSNDTNSNHTSSRQPASYPSPQQYPSPSMSAYAYPPPTGQNDSSYRASPTGSNVSLPSLNLPPIRTIDGRQQPQQHHAQQQQGGPPAMPSALPPPMNHQYYPGHTLPPPQHMNVTSDPNQPMRYPLPPPDGRIMSGGRHKKEIKRRTKTGCLTCRKRRIKCDEAHPACRNCQKSKRECLGYDPIFKAQPGPTNIQPAPIAAPNMQAHTAPGPSYHPPPQGYMPAGTQPYAPSLSAGVNSPRSSTEPYHNDYGAAIDPALKGVVGNSSVHNPQGKRTKIEEICRIHDQVPPLTLTFRGGLHAFQIEEVKNIYKTIYAPALDRFFETRWYSLRGENHLLNDTRLCEQFAALCMRFNTVPTSPESDALRMTQNLEASVVWALMGLAQSATNRPNLANGDVIQEDVNEGVFEAFKRFEAFEKLILGQHLDAKPDEEPKAEPNGMTEADRREFQNQRLFWRHVQTFLALHDDEASAAKEIDDTLVGCRAVLDSHENRDIIYSIIIVRHIGQRLAEFPDSVQRPTSNEEADNRNKLHVAKTFIEQQRTKGTTQIVQRVCNMVVKSWKLPR